jgi:hypothetical protein
MGPPGLKGDRGAAGGLFGEHAAAFAGFTSVAVTGAVGGREQMHARCAAEIPNSHLCHAVEYQLATSGAPVPANGAWMDSSAAVDGAFTAAALNDEVAAPSSGRYIARDPYANCTGWTTTASSSGLALGVGGQFLQSCADARVLACCSSTYRERFRGYTSTTSTGAAGGRAAMHARCGVEFAGAHLCHVAEYERAAPTISPPTTGAWLDASGYASPSGGTIESRAASPNAGRWAGRSVYDNCANWTDAGTSPGFPSAGFTVRPGLVTSMSCAVARSLACCGE